MNIFPCRRATTCPRCGTKRSGKLRDRVHLATRSGDMDGQGRCSNRLCKYRIPLLACSPMFKYGHGAIELREQVLYILGFLNKLHRTHVIMQFNMSMRAYETQLLLFRKHIANYVLTKQEEMHFGELPKWSDIETDEALCFRHHIIKW